MEFSAPGSLGRASGSSPRRTVSPAPTTSAPSRSAGDPRARGGQGTPGAYESGERRAARPCRRRPGARPADRSAPSAVRSPPTTAGRPHRTPKPGPRRPRRCTAPGPGTDRRGSDAPGRACRARAPRSARAEEGPVRALPLLTAAPDGAHPPAHVGRPGSVASGRVPPPFRPVDGGLCAPWVLPPAARRPVRGRWQLPVR